MAILMAADQPIYFPEGSVTGAALDGLCRVAQSICEGAAGSNRLLELQAFTSIVAVQRVERFCYLPFFPVVSVAAVSVRQQADSWGRFVDGGWLPLADDEYWLDVEVGRLHFARFAAEARVTYSSGFDFSVSSNPDVVTIKAIAGLVLTHIANNYGGSLDNYSTNPATGTAESRNYARLDTYLEAILLPLKRYAPRSGS
jgi:hypothetical protein